MSKTIGTSCPHCGQRAIVRSSHQVTPIYRELVLVCTNARLCGWTGKACIEVIATYSLSSMPNPDVSLPLSPSIQRRRIAAELDTAPAAQSARTSR